MLLLCCMNQRGSKYASKVEVARELIRVCSGVQPQLTAREHLLHVQVFEGLLACLPTRILAMLKMTAA